MFLKEKVEIDTRKLYYGFPVVLLGYKDDKFKYNSTTTSSSYTLGNTITVGIKADSCAARYISKYKEFTVNVPCENLMSEIEICGFFSGHNKLQQSDMPYTLGKYVDAPLIDDCFLSLECKVVNIIENEGYINIIGEIKRRIADKYLVSEDGKVFYSENMKTIHFSGCSSKRVYRYLSDEVGELGVFVEGGTNNCG
ncbi:flavin reductase family protein [Gemelliphila palaticanis]|uniref:Flavin reductase n=1 Tax=Gemelliphila palaticanis TaxID=81950 RepID=A0ABX2SZQ5_9BACL|nr:flavin reductase [Gemella palaticanis]MBF0715928.1 flavin reductase [Gemella palaticanis]NYS47858.1 flavin reductase [Gemella palaticanis]